MKPIMYLKSYSLVRVTLVLVVNLIYLFVVQEANGIVPSVQEYCDKFDNYNVKPLICLLKTNPNAANVPGRTSTTTHSYGWEWETEEDDNCACEVNCFPSNINLLTDPIQCQPCGTTCAISLNFTPRCSCAVLGPSTSTTGAGCQCSVTCAPNPTSSEDPLCIFNVTQIRGVLDTSRPYTCDCDQSRAAQNNEFPDFNCVCQATG